MSSNRNVDRPPLKPSDIYRPRLGAQKRPLWETTMAEMRAWRAVTAAEAKAQPAAPAGERDI